MHLGGDFSSFSCFSILIRLFVSDYKKKKKKFYGSLGWSRSVVSQEVVYVEVTIYFQRREGNFDSKYSI